MFKNNHVTLSQLVHILHKHNYSINLIYNHSQDEKIFKQNPRQKFFMFKINSHNSNLPLKVFISALAPHFSVKKAYPKHLNKVANVINRFIKTSVKNRHYIDYYDNSIEHDIVFNDINTYFLKYIDDPQYLKIAELLKNRYLTLKQYAKIVNIRNCHISLEHGSYNKLGLGKWDYYFAVNTADYDLEIDAEISGDFNSWSNCVTDPIVRKATWKFANTPISKRQYKQYWNLTKNYNGHIQKLLHHVLTSGLDGDGAYIDRSVSDIKRDCNRIDRDFDSSLRYDNANTKNDFYRNKNCSKTIQLQLTHNEVKYLNWLHQVGDADGNKIYGNNADTIHELLHQNLEADRNNPDSNFKI